LILCCVCVANLKADAAIFTAYNDDNKPKANPIDGTTCGPPLNLQPPYLDSGIFQVPTSERYEVFNSDPVWGLQPVIIGVYTAQFQSGNVSSNRYALIEGGYGQVDLQSGVDYELVVQPRCGLGFDVFIPFHVGVAIAPLDPASTALATGGGLRPLPAYMQGFFTGDEPKYNDGGNNFLYEANGPIHVPSTGVYYLNPIVAEGYVGPGIWIHDAPFDPEHPFDNVVPYIADQAIYLRADQDYYFVESLLEAENETGKWIFTLAQQSEDAFFINAGMNGNWWNPQLAGQGFFVDVLEDQGAVFVGWFTYDVDAPSNPDEATVGYSGSRWLTAYGPYEPYEGTSADLAIELTTGGILGEVQGVVQVGDYGTMHLDFQDCSTGTISYDIPSANVAGHVDIVRIDHGNEGLCGRYFLGYAGLLLTD
jgi:hypothetical protein